MKIFISIGSRANYSSIKSFIRGCHEDSEIELVIACFASATLDKYGNVAKLIEEEGFPVKYKLINLLDGDSVFNMAKSTGLALIDITSVLSIEKPDYCLTVGDRFETMATAIASSYSNIRLIHTMGGELSGSIDESIRHAISKLSHVHFTASKEAHSRVIGMGEDPKYTFQVGCPRLDIVAETIKESLTDNEIQSLNNLGVGSYIDNEKDLAIISMHPVTTEDEEIDLDQIIKICLGRGLQVVCLWPNADFGTEKIAKSIRILRESGEIMNNNVRFYKNLPITIYIKLLAICKVLIGNSSSGIREGAFIGTPCINLGNRQKDRERGPNVIDIPIFDRILFENAIENHLKNGKYDSSEIYGNGKAAHQMINTIKSINPSVQKTFYNRKSC